MHTWRVKAYDRAGNSALSETRTINVSGSQTPLPVRLQSSQKTGPTRFEFRFGSTVGQNYTVQFTTNWSNWLPLLFTNANSTNTVVVDSTATNIMRLYRVFVGP
jgi:hypothetical protein